jgi:hypothetical protein
MMNDSTTAQPSAFQFTDDELARLSAYRAAIRAGFFSDYGVTGPRSVSQPEPDRSAAPTCHPFTEAELWRLTAYRTAVWAHFSP